MVFTVLKINDKLCKEAYLKILPPPGKEGGGSTITDKSRQEMID
jgi:hypothetical protein